MSVIWAPHTDAMFGKHLTFTALSGEQAGAVEILVQAALGELENGLVDHQQMFMRILNGLLRLFQTVPGDEKIKLLRDRRQFVKDANTEFSHNGISSVLSTHVTNLSFACVSHVGDGSSFLRLDVGRTLQKVGVVEGVAALEKSRLTEMRKILSAALGEYVVQTKSTDSMSSSVSPRRPGG